jgi:hypothetical protein
MRLKRISDFTLAILFMMLVFFPSEELGVNLGVSLRVVI